MQSRRPIQPQWMKECDLGELFVQCCANDAEARPSLAVLMERLKALETRTDAEEFFERPIEHTLPDCCCRGKVSGAGTLVGAASVVGGAGAAADGRRGSLSSAPAPAAAAHGRFDIPHALRTTVGGGSPGGLNRDDSELILSAPGSEPASNPQSAIPSPRGK